MLKLTKVLKYETLVDVLPGSLRAGLDFGGWYRAKAADYTDALRTFMRATVTLPELQSLIHNPQNNSSDVCQMPAWLYYATLETRL